MNRELKHLATDSHQARISVVYLALTAAIDVLITVSLVYLVSNVSLLSYTLHTALHCNSRLGST